MTDKSEDDEADDDRPVEQGTSVVEWAAAAVGAVLFVAMIGYLALLGFQDVDGVPQIDLASSSPIRQGTHYLVEFTATNQGKATALSVTVEATLHDGEKEVERRETTIDYLPPQSSRSGGFIFRRDPAQLQLRLNASSYLHP